MIICFILPAFTRKPQGGYKMAFEYANRLAKKGHIVKLLFLNEDVFPSLPKNKFFQKHLGNFITKKGPNWFKLRKDIKLISSLKNDFEQQITDVDTLIATAVETVGFVEKISKYERKAYFIQDYENWNVRDNILIDTYKTGFQNIVVASWLKEIVDRHALSPSVVIKNPVDTNVYKVVTPIEKRRSHSISLLYHENEHKGIKYALEVLYRLKEKYNDLWVEMFGIFPKPKNLPKWIHYIKGATQQQTIDIYNKTEIFLCATVEEGYGLTGLEAMSCGTVLVSTAYQGVLEYAIDGVNALLSPVKNVDALVENISKLFEDDRLRQKLAKAGAGYVKENFSWNKAVDLFEEALKNAKGM